MSSWVWWLVLGLLIGWLIEWVIDWLYWRRRMTDLQAELASLRSDHARVGGELRTSQNLVQQNRTELGGLTTVRADNERMQNELVSLRSTSDQCQQEVATLRTTLSGVQVENARMRDELEAARKATVVMPAPQRDPLIDVNGIGPVYEKRLFDAGIFTFAQLAALTTDQLREIIKPERWQEQNMQAWIDEARQFAQQRSKS